MSDSHEEYNGGHELENLPAVTLLKIIFGLGAIVLAAVFVVVQFFYQQQRYLEIEDNGAVAGHYLNKYWGEMDEQKKGLAKVAKGVKKGSDLKAQPAYKGWANPDDAAKDK